jgi:hypothetical protein
MPTLYVYTTGNAGLRLITLGALDLGLIPVLVYYDLLLCRGGGLGLFKREY